MTPSEANKIDINNETNLDKLRELVKYWQNLAYQAELRISKLQPGFTLDQLNDNEKSETNKN
ncbi:MAG: hypothetical protein ACI7YS_16165 [Flavobacterium sp.]